MMLLNSISGVDLSQDWSAIKLAEVGLVIQHKPSYKTMKKLKASLLIKVVK